NTQMASDARTRVQLIDTYFRERTLDGETITQVPSLQSFMALPPQTQKLQPLNYMTQAQHASYALAAGVFRDKNYRTWALFNKQGQPLLAYPQPKVQSHGQYLVPPQYLQEVEAGKTFISDVYYDATSKKATVDIYSPVITLQPQVYLGFVRGSLSLDNIWSIVKDDQGNNGAGSYAFILDQNGVYIAHTDSNQLFKSVASFPASVLQRVQTEVLYGGNGNITLVANSAFNNALHNKAQTTLFATQPPGLQEQYQVAERTMTSMPWHYFVLS